MGADVGVTNSEARRNSNYQWVYYPPVLVRHLCRCLKYHSVLDGIGR